MYCRKCGNQLEEDALFCSKCGTKAIMEDNENISISNKQNIQEKEVSKPIIDNDVITEKINDLKGSFLGIERKNLYIIASIIGIVLIFVIALMTKGMNSNTKAYEAYEEFYREFYDRHLDKEVAIGDCGGQILIDEKGKPILALCDITVANYNPTVDVYLYEYKGGKVKEITRKTGIVTSDDGLYIDVYEGKITLCTSPMGDENSIIYVLGENGFEYEAEIEAYVFGKNMEDADIIEFWVRTLNNTENELFISFFRDTDELCAFNGSKFEGILRRLANENASTMIEVKKSYCDFLKAEDIDRAPYFVYVKDNLLYNYMSEDDKLYYINSIGELEFDERIEDIPEEIEGLDIEIGSLLVMQRVKELKIDDIASLEYSDTELTITTQSKEQYKVLTKYAPKITNVRETEWVINEEKISEERVIEDIKSKFDSGKIKEISFSLEWLRPNKQFLYECSVILNGYGEEENKVYKAGEPIKEERYDSSGALVGYTTKEFYEGGALHTDYNLEGIKTHAREYVSVKTGEDAYTLYEKADYYYDTEGNIFESYVYEYNDSYKRSKQSYYNGNELVTYTLYEYWGNGEYKSYLTYNSSGNLIEEWGFDENGNRTKFETYEY